MSISQSKPESWQDNFRQVAGRMISAAVTGTKRREEQERFVGVVLAVQPLFAFIILTAATPVMSIATALGVVAVIAGCSLMLIISVAVSRQMNFAAIGGMLLLSAALAISLSLSGGFTGPLACMILLPVAEAWWISRSRAAIVTGMCASIAIAFSVLLFKVTGFNGEASSWLVLAPGLWVLTLLWRMKNLVMQGNIHKLEASEAAAIEELQSVVVMTVSEQGHVTAASRKTRSVMGLHPGLLLGEGFFHRLHVADRVLWMTAIADIRDGADCKDIDIRLRLPLEKDKADNSYHAFHASFARSEDGCIHVFVNDDRRIQALREEIEIIREKSEVASVTKDRFLASVSHELRTPLNAIIGFSDILNQELFGSFEDPRQKEYIELISKSGQHLLSVVNAILDVSKIESGAYEIQTEPFDLAEAAKMPMSIAGQLSEEKKIVLKQKLEDESLSIVADRRAVQQILINLLSNAVKFSHHGGEVTFGARKTGNQLTLWVNDNGIGISSDDLERIGEPFMQIQNDYTRNYEGTGLGLSLVKGLVGLHKGTMRIDSEPGKGTCVAVTLPQPDQDARTARQTNQTREDMSDHGPLRITA